MELGLQDKVAIVTGASRGIGQAIALSLAAEGASLMLFARGRSDLVKLQQQITDKGGRAEIISGNATLKKDIQKVITKTILKFGRLDILVNNVGGAGRSAKFDDLTEQDWVDAFQLNVMSAVHMTQLALPFLSASPAARIINISSIVGVKPGAFNPHYAVCKAGIINLTSYLSRHLAPSHILVNAVCPGPIKTDGWEKQIKKLASQRSLSVAQMREQLTQEAIASIPLGRIGSSWDVAAVVTFLASDQAGWITGSCIHVNGGKATL